MQRWRKHSAVGNEVDSQQRLKSRRHNLPVVSASCLLSHEFSSYWAILDPLFISQEDDGTSTSSNGGTFKSDEDKMDNFEEEQNNEARYAMCLRAKLHCS